MTVINRNALLPFGARQLFDLVNDIEAYPKFLDGCVGAQVLHRSEALLEARLDLARGGIKQSFSTRNRMVDAKEITLELIDGPFEYFSGRWDFHALGDVGCKLSLHLEFTMRSGVLGAAAARLFDKVSNNLVDAVSTRALELYG